MDTTWYQSGAGQPLGLRTAPAPAPADAGPGVRALRIEFTSRGDRVPGRVLLPERGEGPFPLVLLQHGLGGSKDAAYLDVTAGPWVRGGAAVASIDFPLHGERADAKLSSRLVAAIAPGGDADAGSRRELVVEFVRQAVVDLGSALDASEQIPVLDAGRVVYAGFSLGTILGAVFCGLDPRPRAAALALGGGGHGPAETDPVHFVARIAPRPLLFVNAGRDETIPRAASEALFAAAGEPKEILWFEEATHQRLPGVALKAMWRFLAAQLELTSDPAPGGGCA